MVFGILDRATQVSPGLIAPQVTLSFTGGDSGGIGALADAVGLGGSGAALADGLIGLRLHRGLAPDVDWAEIVLTPVSGGPDMPTAGDSGSIDITVGDRTSAFACTVDLVETRGDGTLRLTATNGGRVLARMRRETAFAEQTPGAIIDALCAEAEVDSSAGNAGETLPQYVVDAGMSVLDHVARLAETAGRTALFNDEGGLELVDDTASGEVVATLAQGGDLLDARLGTRAEAGAVTIDGAGAGEQGGNAWAWLRKEAGPHRAEAGRGPPDRRSAAPWVRAPDAASALAEARARSHARQAAPGRVLVAGTPDAVPGALIDLQGTAQDGSWRVLTLDMSFDRDRGLIGEIRVAPLADSGGSGALGGLL